MSNCMGQTMSWIVVSNWLCINGMTNQSQIHIDYQHKIELLHFIQSKAAKAFRSIKAWMELSIGSTKLFRFVLFPPTTEMTFYSQNVFLQSLLFSGRWSETRPEGQCKQCNAAGTQRKPTNKSNQNVSGRPTQNASHVEWLVWQEKLLHSNAMHCQKQFERTNAFFFTHWAAIWTLVTHVGESDRASEPPAAAGKAWWEWQLTLVSKGGKPQNKAPLLWRKQETWTQPRTVKKNFWNTFRTRNCFWNQCVQTLWC